MNNLRIVNGDTDSITVCKPDGSAFTKDEQTTLLNNLNSLFPSQIKWTDDGYYEKIVVVRAKNYLLKKNGKVIIKGSALKCTSKEVALKEMVKEILDHFTNGTSSVNEIYLKYIKEAMNVKDITRWAFKKTITDKILSPERTNEQKIFDALQGTEYQEGDKRYFFFKEDGSLCLVEKFNGEYDKIRLVKKIYDTMLTFENIIDVTQLKKYHLKKFQKELYEV